MKREYGIVELIQALNGFAERGTLPVDFPYTPKEAEKILKDFRKNAIKAKEQLELLAENPKELIERVNETLADIDSRFPDESKFLNVIVNQKLAPEEFYTRVMNLMCDLSNAQSGLVTPTQALIALSNYNDVLEILSKDEALKAEAAKFAQKSAS